MKILNFGSLNLDHVYRVDHLVRPGETLSSQEYRQFCGGKGCNQSIAIARAGGKVFHAGKIGADGLVLKERLEKDGVDASLLLVGDVPTGHAIIQVNAQGENAIVLFGGANQAVTRADVERTFEGFQKGDWLLVQNEISAIPFIMEQAAAQGMTIVFNPAPVTPAVDRYPLDLVRYFVLNEVEGAELTLEKEPDRIISVLLKRYPSAAIVLTLGASGVWYREGSQFLKIPAIKVKAVDTTAAGDTFIGYLVAEIARKRDAESALRMACRAAALCVTRPGAADSIPTRREVERLM